MGSLVEDPMVLAEVEQLRPEQLTGLGIVNGGEVGFHEGLGLCHGFVDRPASQIMEV